MFYLHKLSGPTHVVSWMLKFSRLRHLLSAPALSCTVFSPSAQHCLRMDLSFFQGGVDDDRNICKACFIQLHDFMWVRLYLTDEVAILVAYALLSSHPDCCNSFFKKTAVYKLSCISMVLTWLKVWNDSISSATSLL